MLKYFSAFSVLPMLKSVNRERNEELRWWRYIWNIRVRLVALIEVQDLSTWLQCLQIDALPYNFSMCIQGAAVSTFSECTLDQFQSECSASTFSFYLVLFQFQCNWKMRFLQFNSIHFIFDFHCSQPTNDFPSLFPLTLHPTPRLINFVCVKGRHWEK